MRILAIALACAAALLPVAADSLLENGGFEQGEPPAGWNLPPREVFTVERSLHTEGKRSLLFTNYSPEREGPWTISHLLPAPPGQMLRVSGQIRPSGFKGTVRALLLSGNPLSGDLLPVGRSTLVAASDGAVTSGWQPFTFLAAATPYGGQASLRLIFQGSGMVWLDALTVTPEGPLPDAAPLPAPMPLPLPVAANLLRDGSFEGSGFWQSFFNPRRAHGIVCAFDRGEAFEGNCSALVTNRSPFYQDPAGWKQERSAPAPGAGLKLEGCLQTEGVQGTAYLRLECWGRKPATAGDAAGEDVLLAAANSAPVSGSASWRPAAVSLRVPEGAARVVASCVLAGRGNAWFDALRLAAR